MGVLALHFGDRADVWGLDALNDFLCGPGQAKLDLPRPTLRRLGPSDGLLAAFSTDLGDQVAIVFLNLLDYVWLICATIFLTFILLLIIAVIEANLGCLLPLASKARCERSRQGPTRTLNVRLEGLRLEHLLISADLLTVMLFHSGCHRRKRLVYVVFLDHGRRLIIG